MTTGTILKKRFASWGVESCRHCEMLAREMDILGPNYVAKNKKRYVQRILKNLDRKRGKCSTCLAAVWFRKFPRWFLWLIVSWQITLAVKQSRKGATKQLQQ